MRVLLQRVRRATAILDGTPVANIGLGLAAFVGFGRDDTQEVVCRTAEKVAHLRIFDQPGSAFGRSLLDVDGEVLTLSQFTLCADTSRGRRPDFSRAAPVDRAARLYVGFARALESAGVHRVVAGPFRQRLVVEVENWGPFSLVIDSEERRG